MTDAPHFDFFHGSGSCSLAIRIVLEEFALPYTAHRVTARGDSEAASQRLGVEGIARGYGIAATVALHAPDWLANGMLSPVECKRQQILKAVGVQNTRGYSHCV